MLGFQRLLCLYNTTWQLYPPDPAEHCVSYGARAHAHLRAADLKSTPLTTRGNWLPPLWTCSSIPCRSLCYFSSLTHWLAGTLSAKALLQECSGLQNPAPTVLVQHQQYLDPGASSGPHAVQEQGLFLELSPGPLAPWARIMPLDQTASW